MLLSLCKIKNVKGYTFNTKYKFILLSRRRKLMKKSIIAGAGVAALAMAALPFAGVFAETTIQDHITVTVNSSCQLDITPSTAGGSTANEWYGSGNAGSLVTPAAGTKSDPGSGTATSVVVKCNDAKGYKISAAFTPLQLNGVTSAQDIAYSATTEAAPNSQTWTAYANSLAITPGATALDGQSTMTDSYAFSYKVGLGANQAAGDYTGTATYTLSAKE